MSHHEELHSTQGTSPPDPTLVTVCTISTIMEITRRVLNQLDGLGVAVINKGEVSVDDQIARLVYEGLQMKLSEGTHVQS